MKLLGKYISSDTSIKSVLANNSGEIVEVSLLNNKPYDVICVPTFHYCNLGCKMCHLTYPGLKKCQTKVTIDELLEAITKTVSDDNKRITNKNKLLVSFMGVGEPLLNFELIKELYLKEDYLKKLGYDDVTYSLSTMMPNDNLKHLTNEINDLNLPLKIHFSLHSSIDQKRKELIPSSTLRIDDAYKLLENYQKTIVNNPVIMNNFHQFHNNDNVIETHYTLIDDINDSAFELSYLIYYLDRYKSSVKFIEFNEKKDMQASSKVDKWVNIIKENIFVDVKIYNPPGKDIGSSCGCFTKHFYLGEVETEEEYEEFLKWDEKYKVKELNL